MGFGGYGVWGYINLVLSKEYCIEFILWFIINTWKAGDIVPYRPINLSAVTSISDNSYFFSLNQSYMFVSFA